VAENVFTSFWWGDAFETLEVQPELGRGMTWEETVRGDPVAVLSHRLWTGAFDADPALVGSSITMNGNAYTVVGIMPAGTILSGTDLWIPMGVEPSRLPRGQRQFQMLARIAPGYSLSEVNAEMEAIARRTEQAYVADFEEYGGWRLEAWTWTTANVGTLRPAAYILLGAVGFVLLLVCTNIASLLLARSTQRRREMALRRAMGAGRGRLVRQVLTESVTLSLLGGVIGVSLAWFGVAALQSAATRFPFLSGGIAMNDRVLMFSAAVRVLAGIAFGLAPAFQGARSDIQMTLKADTSAATGTGSRLRMQRVSSASATAVSACSRRSRSIRLR
jgi:hypothetical protein